MVQAHRAMAATLPSLLAKALLLATWLPLAAIAEDEADCESHPGGCRCYYDALADGCPSSLGHDSQVAMCSCGYEDNTWLHVLTNFVWAFRQGELERHLLAEKFAVRLEAGGVLSLDVGYTERVQCGEPLAQAYPGTNFEVDEEEIHKFARNMFWPEVRQKLNDLCLPGRAALQLLCLHAELGLRNGHAAAAYARQLARIFPLIEGCVEKRTPWPLPGLAGYLRLWKSAELPPAGAALSAEAAKGLSWWPEPGAMRGKLPEESEGHYWPCVPLMDRSCFPAGTDNLHTSCEHCCDPAKGPTGEAACFGGEWTFARCCRTPGGRGRFY